MIYFLDNQNDIIMGSFIGPNCTVLTRDEYTALSSVAPADRHAHLTELRTPKPEPETAPEVVTEPEVVNG